LTPCYSDHHYTATLRYASPHFTQLHFTTFHHTSTNYTSLHFTTLHPTTLHPATLHHTSPNYTSPNYTSPHFTQLRFTTLYLLNTLQVSWIALVNEAQITNDLYLTENTQRGQMVSEGPPIKDRELFPVTYVTKNHYDVFAANGQMPTTFVVRLSRPSHCWYRVYCSNDLVWSYYRVATLRSTFIQTCLRIARACFARVTLLVVVLSIFA
jgi:hypothetical protein